MSEPILFRNAMIWDGSAAPRFAGEVLVEGRTIAAVSPERIEAGGARTIDAAGRTLMPGLVEGHAHLSFGGAARNTDLGDIPPEEHTLLTMRNARTLLDAGFTSAYSAASAKLRLDVVIRNEIRAGRLPGPRLRAAGPEITVTAGLGDEDQAHMSRSSFGIVADGPDAVTRAVRTCIREGVDNIKINISGDDFVHAAKGGMTVMSEAEVRAAVEAAHDFGKRVSCHARAASSVKRAVRCGVDVIYHCDSADEEALDLLEGAKDRIFVGPAIGLIHNTLHEAGAWGIDYDKACRMGIGRVMEQSQATYAEMRRRGIPVVIGGDYGFAWVPQGTNARDIEHFVRLFGYSPVEALRCATAVGGRLMGAATGEQIGQVAPGWLADLLLVDGDPTSDVTVLQRPGNLLGIMQDGRWHKEPDPRELARLPIAAE